MNDEYISALGSKKNVLSMPNKSSGSTVVEKYTSSITKLDKKQSLVSILLLAIFLKNMPSRLNIYFYENITRNERTKNTKAFLRCLWNAVLILSLEPKAIINCMLHKRLRNTRLQKSDTNKLKKIK